MPTLAQLFTVVFVQPCLSTRITQPNHGSSYHVHPYPSPVRLQHAFQTQNSPKMFHPKGLKPHLVSTRLLLKCTDVPHWCGVCDAHSLHCLLKVTKNYRFHLAH